MTTDEPLALASVGLGWWGRKLADAAQADGAARVATCFARSPKARESFAVDYGCRAAETFEQVLADDEVRGVLLATPHSTHAEMIQAAAAAGKHIFVEKPLALTVEEGRRAADAAAANGVVLQVGHNRRRQTANRRIKTMINAGELGVVHLLHGRILVPNDQTPRAGWRSDPDESPVGGMTALGIHMVDTFQYLMGPITTVHAVSRRLWGAGRLDDISVITFEFERGPLGVLETSLVLPKATTTMVAGTSATVWNEDDGERFYVQRTGEQVRNEQPADPVDTVREQIAEFITCVRDRAAPEVGWRQGLAAVAVLESVVRSAATGQTVPVRRTG